MTNETSGFRLRLQAQIGRTLTTDQTVLTTSLAGKEVTIRSRDGKPLSGTEWIVLEARGFPTEPEARVFGERLRANVQLAALCSHLGADTGLDNVLSQFYVDPPNRRSMPEVHGLSVFPDDDSLSFPTATAKATPILDPALFLGAMRELAEQSSIVESTVALPVRLLNLAFINPQPLARIVLAVSAVENVAEDEDWTSEQHALIKNLATEIEDPEVKEAVKRMRKISIRQGIKRVLSRNSLGHLWGEWDDLYERRSRLFHGGREFTKQEAQKLASDALRLCGKIILTIVKRNGITLPSVASEKFKGL